MDEALKMYAFSGPRFVLGKPRLRKRNIENNKEIHKCLFVEKKMRADLFLVSAINVSTSAIIKG